MVGGCGVAAAAGEQGAVAASVVVPVDVFEDGELDVGIVLASSHHNAGWIELVWARALLTGPYYTDHTPEEDRWRLTDVEMRRSARAVAIWEDDYDRAVGAVDVAAHSAGVKSPYLHIGRRMSAAAFAAGPRPDDTVVCVSIEMLDPARSEDLY